MLSKHTTQLKFDGFTSDPLDITNGTTQGCSLSMLIYTFYNADLIDISRGKNELSTGFVDDCAFITIGDTLTDTHLILTNMMERTVGGLDWPLNHNSPFKLTKLACMDCV